MSDTNKPKIYAHCAAGCLWEAVHKSDFEASAALVRQDVDDYGACVLTLGKQYKIYAPKGDDNNFTCGLTATYLVSGTATTFTFSHTNNDAYADCFVFRLLAAEVNEAATELTYVYEIAGVRYTETITGESLAVTSTSVIVRSATKVFIVNDGAETVSIKGKDGVTFTPSIDDDCNLSWTNDGGLPNPPTINIKGSSLALYEHYLELGGEWNLNFFCSIRSTSLDEVEDSDIENLFTERPFITGAGMLTDSETGEVIPVNAIKLDGESFVPFNVRTGDWDAEHSTPLGSLAVAYDTVITLIEGE